VTQTAKMKYIIMSKARHQCYSDIQPTVDLLTTVLMCTADSGSAGDNFVFAGKTHNGAFRGIFRGGREVEAPSKNPKNCPIMCFAPDKKNNLTHFQNLKNIGIFLLTSGIVDDILSR
jgi:hypothetical protein